MNFQPLFDKAKAMGFDSVQAHYVQTEDVDLQVFKGELDKHQMSNTSGLVLKGIYKGKMGKMTTEVIDLNEMDQWLKELKNSALLIESDDEVFIYEGDESYKEVEGLYQEALVNVPIKDKMKMVFDLEKKISEMDSRITISSAFYAEETKKVIIQNSKGLNLEKKVNNAFFGAQMVAKEDDDSRSSFDYRQSNDMSDFNSDEIAKEVVQKGLSMLGAKTIKSGDYEILLKNSASASLLAAHLSMFSAESVQKGMSKLKGKIGNEIGNKKITIVDNPFKAKSTRSGAFDDEGVATQYKEMVSKGVLKTYLHNLKTAKKDSLDSTGNGFGGGVSPTNFYLLPGEKSYEEAVESIEKGLIISDLQGLHSGTNPISGDFSLQANGYYVEEGKIVKPVALITIAGNYLDLLNDVDEIYNDLKFGFNYIGSPSIKIKSLMVSGE